MTRQPKPAMQDSTNSRSASPQSVDRRKRRKISQACEQCRTRKTRCDGSKPVCGECASRPSQITQCRYSSNQIKNKGYDDYVSSLLARIQELEARQDHQQPSIPTPQLLLNNQEQRTQSTMDASNVLVSVQLSPHDEQLPTTEASPVDAMGAGSNVGHASKEKDTAYYGGSSAISLVQQVYQAIGNNIDFSRAPSPSRAPKQLNVSGEKGHIWNSTSLEQFWLLPRPLTDTILSVYWDKVHHLYPFVHKPTFMTAYEHLWVSQSPTNASNLTEVSMLGSKAYGPDSYIFHCALNGMLALATQFMDIPLPERARLASMFAGKSRGLCKLDLFDDGSLASIQALLLMTMYLQSTPFPNRCWNCIGITCRLAQGLGLHIESPQLLAKLTPIEMEMRRRVWHGCVMLDTIVSTTLGRPMMLYKFGLVPVPLPQPVDDDYLLEPKTQPSTHVPWTHFYVESIKMYQLLADVIAKVYGKTNLHPGPGERETGFEEITNLDSAISKLENELPQHFHPIAQLPTSPELQSSAMFKQQAFVLSARFLHLRILLYRPTFLRYWQRLFAQEASLVSISKQSSGLSEVTLLVTQSISSACVEHCANLIELIHHNLISSTTGAWWYNLFYVRTAGIIIVLALTCSAMSDAVGNQKLRLAWENCQAVLAHLESFNPTVSQCLKQLTRMYRHLLDFKHRQINGEAHCVDDDDAAAAISEANYAFPSYDELPFFGETFDTEFEYQHGFLGADLTVFDEILRQDYENLAANR